MSEVHFFVVGHGLRRLASPVTESSQVGLGITNPYGRSKFVVEEILRDFSKSPQGSEWGIMILRYFNPVGAHESGQIGEDPMGIPNNLMPYVLQVAIGRRSQLTIFGDDYPTPDGTGVRDYIHVMDLAEGHRKALEYLGREGEGFRVFNLGSGRGYSVLEMVNCLKAVSNVPIPYTIGPRREGDLAEVYADSSRAEKELGWTASRGLQAMCEDMWNWQKLNPKGFAETVAADSPADGCDQNGGSSSRRQSFSRRLSLAALLR